MKKWALAAVAACFSLTLLAVHPSHSDQPAPRAGAAADAFAQATPARQGQAAQAQPGQARTRQAPAAQDQPAPRRQQTRRLPNQFGRLGISGAQRQTIYDLQAKYAAEIEELEEQLAAVREKRDKEIEAVLTADQKQELARLRKEAEERRRAAAAARAESSADESQNPPRQD